MASLQPRGLAALRDYLDTPPQRASALTFSAGVEEGGGSADARY